MFYLEKSSSVSNILLGDLFGPRSEFKLIIFIFPINSINNF